MVSPAPVLTPEQADADAALVLRYRREADRTVLHHAHRGPIRVMKTHYPEGDAVCHNVLVHPPGGLVGGDVLDLDLALDEGAHALVTTPGATRFYRSEHTATQRLRVRLAAHAKLEWLPMETLAYSGCHGVNEAVFELAPEAALMAWDVTSLGLAASGQPFVAGELRQHMQIKGAWLDRAKLAALDTTLLQSPVGLAGKRTLATLIWAQGQALKPADVSQALDSARACIASSPLAHWAGATQAHAQVVVVRALADAVEPAMALLQAIWAVWRQPLWGLPAEPDRIWRM